MAIAAANSPDYKSALAAGLLFIVIGMIVPIGYLRDHAPFAEHMAIGVKP